MTRFRAQRVPRLGLSLAPKWEVSHGPGTPGGAALRSCLGTWEPVRVSPASIAGSGSPPSHSPGESLTINQSSSVWKVGTLLALPVEGPQPCPPGVKLPLQLHPTNYFCFEFSPTKSPCWGGAGRSEVSNDPTPGHGACSGFRGHTP